MNICMNMNFDLHDFDDIGSDDEELLDEDVLEVLRSSMNTLPFNDHGLDQTDFEDNEDDEDYEDL